MKKIIATLVIALCVVGSAMAQDELSFERKQAIDSLALEKVRDLSKYIKIVGSKETPFSEANRVIDRAEELFMNDAEMMSSVYYSFAMENAHPKIKELARYQTASNREYGVLQGIQKLIDDGLCG